MDTRLVWRVLVNFSTAWHTGWLTDILIYFTTSWYRSWRLTVGFQLTTCSVCECRRCWDYNVIWLWSVCKQGTGQGVDPPRSPVTGENKTTLRCVATLNSIRHAIVTTSTPGEKTVTPRFIKNRHQAISITFTEWNYKTTKGNTNEKPRFPILTMQSIKSQDKYEYGN